MKRSLIWALAGLWLMTAGASHAAEWVSHTDAASGFSIDVPGDFIAEDRGDRLSLQSGDGRVQIDVFSAVYGNDMSFAQFAESIASADPRRVITYRAGGDSWFVVSGYLDADGSAGNTIFYAKFMSNRARDTVSAFEISYPAELRDAMDGLVTRMEKSLTSPRT
ncbi:hypothetical protein SAMN02983003_2123 [Devosia enhydra]|uniref:Uncharacterized protein n=1 Tax=Devosia enhydra TaxID=665118 RepID=A0A1K2HXV0_9HYPH|nr:hypothetical protein [Devosia enhydra]SFZ84627.1 hypothetical protein SAMN02983003_2123 [Devosia enhydra]